MSGVADGQGQGGRAMGGVHGHHFAHGHGGGHLIACIQGVVLRACGAGQCHVGDRWNRGVDGPSTAVAVGAGRDIARQIGLSHLHRASGIGAVGQIETVGGACLRRAPSGAAAGAVLPSRACLWRGDIHRPVAGDAVAGIGACVLGQFQAGCGGCGGVDGPSTAVASGDRCVAGQIGLSHLNQAHAVSAFAQAEISRVAEGGLRGAPGPAAVVAVLPGLANIQTTHRDAGVLGHAICATGAGVGSQGHARCSWLGGVDGPAAGAAADRGEVPCRVGLAHLHRACGIDTLRHSEDGGGVGLGCAPVGAAVGAVLPSGTRLHPADRHNPGLGDVVGVAAACVGGQGQARCRWRGVVQAEGLAVDRANVACAVNHLDLQGVATTDGLPSQAPGVLSNCGDGRAPVAAVVQRHFHCFVAGKCCAQGAADVLRSGLGDEVGAAAARVCAEGRGGDGGRGCNRVHDVGMAVDRAIVACCIDHLHFQGVAAGQCLSGKAPGVLTDRGVGRVPGAAVVQ